MSTTCPSGRVSAVDASLEYVDNAGNICFNIRAYGNGNAQYVKVPITAAQLIAMGGSPVAPVTLIAAPGAGKAILVLDGFLAINFGTTQFTAGSNLQIQQNSINIATTTATLINGAASSIIIQLAFPNVNTTASLGAANAAVIANVASTAFATGDSTLNVHLFYAVVTP